MRSLLIAYVNDDTTDYERIKHAVYAITFIRIWGQYLLDEEISTKHFITSNALHCLEVNLLLLIKLVKSNKLQYIHLISSQNNESFFRCVRSYTGTESMAVNASMKGFISKIQRIQIEEKLMHDLKEDFYFTKLESRDKKLRLKNEVLTEQEIKEAIEVGMNEAKDACTALGMDRRNVDLRKILKIQNIIFNEDEEFDDDFLDATLERIDESSIIEASFDDASELTVGNMQFTNDKTGN